jgi:predicted DNA-binding protein with PD1-like motif
MLKLFTAYISDRRIDAYKECNEEINTFAKENHLKIANVQLLNLTEYAAIEVLFEKDEQLEDKVTKLENEVITLKKEILLLKEESKEKEKFFI